MLSVVMTGKPGVTRSLHATGVSSGVKSWSQVSSGVKPVKWGHVKWGQVLHLTSSLPINRPTCETDSAVCFANALIVKPPSR